MLETTIALSLSGTEISEAQDTLDEIISVARLAKKRLLKSREVMGEDYKINAADAELEKLLAFILSKGFN